MWTGMHKMENYKIVLAGRFGVGKSTIFSRLQKQSGDYVTTLERETGLSSRSRDKWAVLVKTSSGKEVKVTLWDTAGLERHGTKHLPTRSYFSGSHAVILVYDFGRRETLDELKEWLSEAQEYEDNIVASLWGNHRDDTTEATNPVSQDVVEDFCRQFAIADALVFSVNAAHGDSLLTNFTQVVDAVSDNSVARVWSVDPSTPRETIRLRSWTHKLKRPKCCKVH